MHEDNIKEFDRLFRSALQDAEVKAPRGAWKAVSARLDEAAAPAAAAPAAFGWWRWAGLAMAAVVAAGLFFSGTMGRKPSVQENAVAILTNSDNSNQSQKLTAQAQESEPVAEEQAKPARLARIRPIPAGEPGAVAGSCPAEEPVMAEAPEEDVTVQEEPASKPAPARKKGKVQIPASEIDAWAQMALEDSHSTYKPHVALAMVGALSGNESDILARSSRSAHMSAGETSIRKTGIDESSTSAYGIPFSAGLGVRIHFTPRLSVGSGIDYSLLSRKFNGTYNEVNGGAVTNSVTGEITHRMQYIGIPLHIYYDILNGGRAKFYVYGGGEAEYCISNKYSISASPKEILFSDPVNGFQYSVGAGLGVEFKLGRSIGLYLDPGVNYYFHCDQPKNVRTEHPLMFDFEAGLRFNLGSK